MSQPDGDRGVVRPGAALTIRQLAELHRVAQERLGLTAAYLTLTSWSQVAPMAPRANAGAWMDEVAQVALALRKVSRRLAARYYTLARAIGTGFALPDIDGARPGGVVLSGQLYTEFASVLNEVIEATSLDLPDAEPNTDLESSEVTADGQSIGAGDRQDEFEAALDDLIDSLTDMFAQMAPDTDSAEWTDTLEVDTDWEWEEFLDSEVTEQEFLEDLFTDLEADAIKALETATAVELASDRPMRDSLPRIEDKARQRGAVAAGIADGGVLNAGRALVARAGDIDKRRYGWMRVTGSHPCGFCAMLASRGAVYDTAQSAGFKNTYHPNCHCSQVPVFLGTPHYSARDQFFIDNWAGVTEGYSGKNALKVWRRWLTQQYRLGSVPEQDVFGPARQSAATVANPN